MHNLTNDGGLTAIWQHITDAIRPSISADAFNRWFAPIHLVQADENDFVLSAPNQIFQFWIETNYMLLLQKTILGVLGAPRGISFTFETKPASAATSAANNGSSEKKAVEPEPHAPKSRIATLATANGAIRSPGMDARNTFDTFVVGANNQFAHAAAIAVAQTPARTYNPLFLHGGVGLGKTHLMQAVGQHIAQARPGTKVSYLTSEKFTNEYIDAIQTNSTVKFRNKYRKIDVLIIDDIQFLAGKERSQEEFFHTFNTLFDGHKQIILSSDRPPAEIANLEARLVSRCEWGLTAEIQPPDVETRIAILRKKAQAMQVKIHDSTLQFLAERIRTNIRRLEGALNSVAIHISMNGGRCLESSDLEKLLKSVLQEEAKRTVSIDQIQKKVAEHYDIRLADMTSKRRPAAIAFARQVAMYLARERTKSSLSEIGGAFGGRDHGTVIHAHKLVSSRMEKEETVRLAVASLNDSLDR